jgi:MFS family permease
MKGSPVAVVVLIDAFDFTAFLLIIAPIAKEFDVPVPEVAAVLTVTLWMRLLGATASGWLADRIGRKTPLMISIAWYSACNFLAGLAPSFFLLFLFRALLGIGMGAEWHVERHRVLLFRGYARPTHTLSSRTKATPILGALSAAGGQAYLEQQAEKNPVAFMALIGKVLRLQLGGVTAEPIKVQWIRYDEAPSEKPADGKAPDKNVRRDPEKRLTPPDREGCPRPQRFAGPRCRRCKGSLPC